MAKKKINQIPKVNDKFTGSYVQNLMNKQPAVPTVPAQSNTAILPQSIGGNTYTSYVSGADTKPRIGALGGVGGLGGGFEIFDGDGSSSGGTTGGNTGGTSTGGSGTGAGGSTGGTGTEVPKTETGGSTEGDTGGTGGVESGNGTNGSSNKVSYPSYQSWLDTTKKQEESIVEQYNSAINYAEQVKNDAYKKAEDSYVIAMRDAQANFETNQPTYGVTAEQLLASGLTGSGYSDYLAGKAYEARTDEINAARSQMNYAKYLADQNYEAARYQAEQNKFDRQYANDQWKLEYGVQLDNAYKAKVEEVIQGIMSGIYDASMGETILKNYASGGAVSEAVLAALKAADSNYWKSTNSGVIADYINWIESIEAAGGTVNPDMVRAYLKTSTNLSDQEIDTLVSYLGSGGKKPEGGNTGNTGNSGNSGNNGNAGNSGEGSSEDTGSTGDSNNSANTGDSGDDKIKWYEAVLGVLAAPFMIGSLAKSGKEKKQEELIADFTSKVDDGSRPTYAESFGIFKDAMNKHDIGKGSYYNELVEKMNELVKDGVDNGAIGKFNPVAAAVINEMVNGLYVSSGKFSSNEGLHKGFVVKGDNFTVDMGGNNYRVESEGEASDTVKEASKNLNDGVVFGYGSELYVKSGDTAYKIRPRRMFGNKDYDELWKAVYGEALDSLGAKVPQDVSAADELESSTYLNYEKYLSDQKSPLTDKSATNKGNSTALTSDKDNVVDVPTKDPNIIMDPAANLGAKLGSIISKWIINLINRIKKNKNNGTSDSGATDQPSGNINNDINTGLEGMPSIMPGITPGITPGGQQGSGVTYNPADTNKDGTVSDDENQAYQDKLAAEKAEEEARQAALESMKITNAKYEGERGGFLSIKKGEATSVNSAVGTNITVSFDGKKYYLDVGDEAAKDSTAYKACQTGEIRAGQIFADNDGNIYLSRGKDASPLKLKERDGVSFYKGDFEKLKTLLTEDKKITTGGAMFESDAVGSRTDLSKGDNFNVYVNGKTYRVESGGQVADNDPVITAAAGIEDGVVFSYGDEAYLKKGGKIYEIDTRFFRPEAESKLVDAIEANKDSVLFSGNITTIPVKRADSSESFKPGESFEIYNPYGKKISIKVVAKAPNQEITNAANNLEIGAVFKDGNNYFIKGKDGVYLIDKNTAGFENFLEFEGFDHDAPIDYVYNFNNLVDTIDDNGNRIEVNNYRQINRGQPIFINLNDSQYQLNWEKIKENKIPMGLKDIVAKNDKISGDKNNISMFVWNNDVYFYTGDYFKVTFNSEEERRAVISEIENAQEQENSEE